LPTPGIAGGWYVTVSATARKSSSIGSISGEWNACDTASRLVRTPRRAKSSAISATAASAPEITTAAGR